MINPDFIRDNPQVVKDSQLARGENPSLVDDFLATDQLWRNITVEVDILRAEQKALSKEIGTLKNQEKSNPTNELKRQLEELTSKGTKLSEKISELNLKQEDSKINSQKVMSAISNLVHEDAPIGGEKDFKILETNGKLRDFKSEGIEIKDHVELGESLNLIDIDRKSTR